MSVDLREPVTDRLRVPPPATERIPRHGAPVVPPRRAAPAPAPPQRPSRQSAPPRPPAPPRLPVPRSPVPPQRVSSPAAAPPQAPHPPHLPLAPPRSPAAAPASPQPAPPQPAPTTTVSTTAASTTAASTTAASTPTATTRAGSHRAQPPRGWARVRGWLGDPRPALGLVLVTLGLAHGLNLAGWPMFNSDDEGTYYAQAWAVLHEGTLAHYTYWYDHPPLGWLQMALLIEPLSWTTGSLPVVVTGRIIMVGYTLASAVLLYKLARNLRLHPAVAVATPLVWGLCPLTVYEARQVFLDNLALPWLLLAVVLATDVQRRLHLHLLSGIAFAAAVLTKETAVFAGPAVLIALWQSAYRPTRRFSVLGWTTLAGVTVLAYPLYALIKNELLPGPGHVSLAGAITWQLGARTGSGFVLDPHSVANQVLYSWFAQDRILLVAGLAGALVCLLVRRLRPAGVLVLTYAAVALRPQGYLPLMFVIVVLPFAALCVTGLVDVAVGVVARRSGPVRPVGLAALGAAVLTGVVLVAPGWRSHLEYGLRTDANGPYVEAMQYVERSLPRDSVVLTDDIAWNDLVRAGWPSDGFSGAVWYYKLDRDPAAAKVLPRGWRDVDYVLVGRPMGLLAGTEALNKQTDPQVMTAYGNSEVVAKWGPPEWQVELRKVQPLAG